MKKPGQGPEKPLGHRGKRWYVEIMEVEGRCMASIGYTLLPGRTVTWQSTSWQLPDMPISQRLMIEELYDALSILHEQSEQ